MKDKNSRIPFFTIRENTARPVTIEEGTNTLVGTITEVVLSAFEEFRNRKSKKGRVTERWDGKTSERIVNILLGHPYEPFQAENTVNDGAT